MSRKQFFSKTIVSGYDPDFISLRYENPSNSKEFSHMSLIFPIMIAVVEIGGKQYTVEKDMSLVVDRQHSDVGTTITLPALLVASADGKTVKVGAPTVEGSQVSFQVEEHLKAEKVRVFKIKSKKRYMRTQGFRAYQTRLTVTAIA